MCCLWGYFVCVCVCVVLRLSSVIRLVSFYLHDKQKLFSYFYCTFLVYFVFVVICRICCCCLFRAMFCIQIYALSKRAFIYICCTMQSTSRLSIVFHWFSHFISILFTLFFASLYRHQFCFHKTMQSCCKCTCSAHKVKLKIYKKIT